MLGLAIDCNMTFVVWKHWS